MDSRPNDEQTAQMIIACGNPLHGDAGLAWHAARRLEKEPLEGPVRIETHHQLLADMALPLSRCRIAVFLSATRGGEAGAVLSRSLTPHTHTVPAGSAWDPESLLAYTQALYGHCPRAYEVSISGCAFGFGDRLSYPVSRALPQLVDRVRLLLATAPALAV